MKDPLSLYGEYIINQDNPKTKIREDIIEYYYIQMCLMKIAAYLGAAFGGKSVNTICKNLILLKKDINETKPIREKCFICIVGVRNVSEAIEYLKEDAI